MNGLERVFSTVGGQTVDRTALSLVLSLYGAGLTGVPLEEYYSDPILYAKGQLASYKKFSSDVIFGPFALPLYGKAFGSEVKYLKNFSPNLGRPAIKSVKEIDKLVVPDLETNPEIYYFREALRLLKKQFEDKVAIAPIMLTPIDLGVMIFGMDEWLNTVLFDPDSFKKCMDIFLPFCVELGNKFLDDGGSFLVLPAIFANPSIITKHILVEKTLPVLEKFLAQIKGPIVFHSGGAILTPFIELFKDLPNVVGFVINGDEDVSLARTKIHQNQVIVGNIEGPDFNRFSAEELFLKAQELLELTKNDKHFILGTSGADIPLNTPPEKIQALLNATMKMKDV